MHKQLFTFLRLQYKYYSNGLSIVSDIRLPEMQETAKAPNVSIIVGEIPSMPPYTIEKGYYKAVSGGEFLLDIKNVARFLVCGKDTVVIEPAAGASEAKIRLYLLSSVMGMLLHRWNILSLHASSAKIDGKAFLFSGKSGIGKSTLALGLHKQGHEILNDDITSLSFSETCPVVFPGYVHLKLGQDSLAQYSLHRDNYRPLYDERDKLSFPLSRAEQSCKIPLGAIFFPEIASDKIQHSIVHGVEAFELLRANTFRYNFVRLLENSTAHFNQCAALANTVRIIKICRPENVPNSEYVHYVTELIAGMN